jgi:Planctomycete cytochrome C
MQIKPIIPREQADPFKKTHHSGTLEGNTETHMKRSPLLLMGVVALIVGMATSVGILNTPNACAAEEIVSFKEDILPLFKWRCASCHETGGVGYENSGLDLTSYAGVMKGTKLGPMVIPREPEISNLMLLLDWRASPALRMPHGKKQLSSCDRASIRTWIRQGAKDN